MKNFLISASLIAVGVWYFHRVMDDRTRGRVPEERPAGGEIVVAGAPDGTLQGRWPSPTPLPRR
ncbi:MAG TPA: hypothetical protein VJ721_07910 [Chthoniobacterales bacterium]|nr:hypothetical protein [Chthoniobacterales bacterium]